MLGNREISFASQFKTNGVKFSVAYV